MDFSFSRIRLNFCVRHVKTNGIIGMQPTPKSHMEGLPVIHNWQNEQTAA